MEERVSDGTSPEGCIARLFYGLLAENSKPNARLVVQPDQRKTRRDPASREPSSLHSRVAFHGRQRFPKASCHRSSSLYEHKAWPFNFP